MLKNDSVGGKSAVGTLLLSLFAAPWPPGTGAPVASASDGPDGTDVPDEPDGPDVPDDPDGLDAPDDPDEGAILRRP